MPNRIFKHIKTGVLYQVLHYAVECTNARVTPNEAKIVVVYRRYNYNYNLSEIFVRDLPEFKEKFIPFKDEDRE